MGEVDESIRQIVALTRQKPNERCPHCECCDIGPYIGPNNPGSYCCGAYVSGGQCHTIVDAEYGSVPQTNDEWLARSREIKATTDA